MTSSTSARTKVFVCYSHKDRKYLNALLEQLAYYERKGIVDRWDDTKIAAGANRLAELELALDSARVAVLLLSPSFLASNLIAEVKLPRLLQAAREDGVVILPVLVRPCLFEDITELAQFQAVCLPNHSLVPLTGLNSHWRGVLWLQVAREIKRVLDSPPPAPIIAQAQTHEPEQTPVPQEEAQETTSERYRQEVLTDQSLTKLQVLSMTSPLPVTSVYVRLQVHEKVSAHTTGRRSGVNDPLTLMTQQQRHLDTHFTTALEPADAVRKYGRCVIVGNPGAGKTTLLKFLTIEAARRQLAGLPTLPVYISLNDFAVSGSDDLPAYASTLWSKHFKISEERALACIEQEIEAGNALFLLDALDEAVIGDNLAEAEATYQRVFDAITRLANRCSWMVVTARKAGYQQRRKLHAFTELDVLDFRWQEIEQYIDNWFAHRSNGEWRGSADDLKLQLRNAPRLQTLAANPLLLTLIALTYERETDELPQRRAELYEHVVTILLEQWDRDRSRNILRHRNFRVDNQRRLLPEIAWEMHKRGLRNLPASAILPIIERFIPRMGYKSDQAAPILQAITGDNGLLREQAEGSYGFLHLTLQEYFASLHVHKDSELLPYLGDPWWEEVTLLYAGKAHDATPLLGHLVPSNNSTSETEDIFSTKLILAGRALAEYAVADEEIRDHIHSQLFDRLVHNNYTFTRQQIADTLAQIGRAYPDMDINSRLFAMLERYKRLPLGITIANAIKHYGSYELAPILLEFIAKTSVFYSDNRDDNLLVGVCQSAAEAIGRIAEPTRQPELLPRCLELIRDTTADPLNIFYVTLYSLGNIISTETASTLVPLLSDSSIDKGIRQALAIVIGRNANETTLSSLIEQLSNPQIDEEITEDITLALSVSLHAATAPDIVAFVPQRRFSISLRENCAKILGIIGEAVMERIYDLVLDDTLEEAIRVNCAAALTACSIRTRQIEKPLHLLARSDLLESIRSEIVLRLVINSDHTIRSVLPRLRKICEQEGNAWVKYTIKLALGILGDPLTLSFLRESFIHNLIPLEIQVNAARTLARYLPDNQIKDLLNDRTSHSNAIHATEWVERRCALAQALASTDRVSLVPALLDLLDDDTLHEDIRIDIVEAVGVLTEQRTELERLITIWRKYDVRDTLHRSVLVQTLYYSLWLISRRIGVTIVQSGDVYRVMERS